MGKNQLMKSFKWKDTIQNDLRSQTFQYKEKMSKSVNLKNALFNEWDQFKFGLNELELYFFV
jgi:hypothetical protein